MSDLMSLFPFVGEKTVARRLDEMYDRKSIIAILQGAFVGGFVTTVVNLLSPNLLTAVGLWSVLLLVPPVLSIYWRMLQRTWDELDEK